MNKSLNFGGDLDHDTGKMYLGKRALAEVWTLPVLLVQF